MLYQLCVTLQHILNIHQLIIFDDKDSQRVVNLDYQFGEKELAFMITKILLYIVTLLNVT